MIVIGYDFGQNEAFVSSPDVGDADELKDYIDEKHSSWCEYFELGEDQAFDLYVQLGKALNLP